MRTQLFHLPAMQPWAVQLSPWALVTSPGTWQPPPVPSAPQFRALSPHNPEAPRLAAVRQEGKQTPVTVSRQSSLGGRHRTLVAGTADSNPTPTELPYVKKK